MFLAAFLLLFFLLSRRDTKKIKMRIASKTPVMKNVIRSGKAGPGLKIEAVPPTQKAPDINKKQDSQNKNTQGMLTMSVQGGKKPGLARWRHCVPFISQFIDQMREGRRLPSERPEPGQVHRRYQTTSRLKQQSEQEASTLGRSRIV